MRAQEYREIVDKPLLRPLQVKQIEREIAQIDGMLNAEPFIRDAIADKGKMIAQARRLKKQLHDETPRPYNEGERDAAVYRCQQLEESIRQGMPTQAEFGRRGPNTLNRHRLWEQKKKKEVLEWKQIRNRMFVSGMLDDVPPGTNEVANVETLRPNGGGQEDDLSVAQIVRPTWKIPLDAVMARVMTDEQEALLKAVAPDVLKQMALYSNEVRNSVLDKVQAALDTAREDGALLESDGDGGPANAGEVEQEESWPYEDDSEGAESATQIKEESWRDKANRLGISLPFGVTKVRALELISEAEKKEGG